MSTRNRIKELRKEKGLSQKEFAKAFNEFSKDNENVKSISYATVSRWENGENEPKLETWIKLADFFDVPVNYLQGVSNHTKNDKKEIDKLMPLIRGKNGEINENVLMKISNIEADLSEDELIKSDFKDSNLLINILFPKDNNAKYKKIISKSELPKNVTKESTTAGLYTYYLSIVSEMFFSAQNGDEVAKDCIKKIDNIYDKYDTHIVAQNYKKMHNGKPLEKDRDDQ